MGPIGIVRGPGTLKRSSVPKRSTIMWIAIQELLTKTANENFVDGCCRVAGARIRDGRRNPSTPTFRGLPHRERLYPRFARREQFCPSDLTGGWSCVAKVARLRRW